jgi:AraC-like DNA-binding protein
MKEVISIQHPYLGYAQKGYSHAGMSASHSHDELELNLVLKGHSSYLLDSRRYVLDSHTLVWLFSGQEHILLECSQDFEMWVIVFRPELVNKLCESPGYHLLREKDPAGFFCKRILPSTSQEIDRVLTDITSREHNSTLFNAGLAYVLPLAWSIYSTTTVIPPSSDVHPAVENVIHLLNKNPFCDDLATLADQAGLSAARLSRLFKEQIGVSMVHFKNRLRIERFLKLYHKGRRKNIMETALDAGFGSYPQFHREFTRIMGCSPAEFRRRSTTDS